ncbi:VCBS repeat-containing protein [Actinacidiphila alni]|uniref:VCBS repeat-containing protein n=1 Tax=Actinacidiphila alni TaxID=380248 RepID=UPI0033E0A6E4
MAVAVLGTGSEPAVADSARPDVVLQPPPEYVPTQDPLVAAGTTGFLSHQRVVAHGIVSEAYRWTRYDTGVTTQLDPSSYDGIVGTSTAGDAVYVQEVLTDGSYRVLEMNAGTTSAAFRMPTGYRDLGLAGANVVAATVSDNGVTYTGLHLLKLGATGTTSDVLVTGLPEGATLPTARPGVIESSTGTQAALYLNMPDGTVRIGVLDLATGVLRTNNTPVDGTQLRMDASHVIWVTDQTTVHVLPTADLTAPEQLVHLAPIDLGDTYSIGLSRDFVLAVRSQEYADSPDPAGAPLWAYPLSGGAPRFLLRAAAQMFVEAPDSTTLVVGGGSSTNWWVQRVATDSTGAPTITHVAQVPPTQATVESVSVAAGMVTASYDSTTANGGRFYTWGPSFYGSPTDQPGLGYFPCGGSSGCLDQQVWATGDGRVDFVKSGTTVSIRPGDQVTLPSTADVGNVTGAFGRYVLRTSSYAYDPQLEVDDIGVHSNPKTLLTRAAAPAALWGNLLYAADSTPGEITVTDLRTQQIIRTLHIGGAGCTLSRLQVVGRWLWRTCEGDSSANVRFGVWDLTTDKLIPLPLKFSSPQDMLGDGYFISQDIDMDLYLTDFHTGTPVVTDLGIHPRRDYIAPTGERYVWSVDQYGGGLVYRAEDNTLHMTSVGVPTSELTVPDSAVPTTFDRPIGVADWSPVWWLSKPAASWNVTLADSRGRTVAVLSGGATKGAVIDCEWNGTADANHLGVEPGSYTWKLTAQPADGQGPALSRSGSIKVSGRGGGTAPTLYSRDSLGNLWQRPEPDGLPQPFGTSGLIGPGWNTYNVITSLSGQRADGTGDLVGRDSGGSLWYYRGSGKRTAPLAARTKVGPGWNIFNQLVGAGDLTGDGKADLLARDGSGVLWLYRGRGNGTFLARTKVGPGWNIFNQLVGAGDLTGDRKADLLARDSAGVLWLYQGKGNGSFAARTKVGPGWNTYNQLVGAGDITGGGRPDLVARDTKGDLWCYVGTGVASAPFASRVKIGSGWNNYDVML